LQSVLGDKLVKTYLFDSDLTDDPLLPSPNQLKYKILIKNKKIIKTILQQAPAPTTTASNPPLVPSLPYQASTHHSMSTITSSQRRNLSHTSKSSIRNPKMSVDIESVNTNNQNGDFYLGEESPSPADPTPLSAAAKTGHEGSRSFGQKLRSIGSKLTIAEPRLTKNVRNFIHKSKSLTDSAFHKPAASSSNGSSEQRSRCETGSKMSVPNQSEVSSQVNGGRATGGSSVSSVVVARSGGAGGGDKESASESTTNSVVGLASAGGGEATLEGGGYVRRMRQR